ncbi:MAG: hypothetical protein M3490_05460, partial [Chloroflexota bacterium]|nr:hypothetical protein [Chloroflexota bacterium]
VDWDWVKDQVWRRAGEKPVEADFEDGGRGGGLEPDGAVGGGDFEHGAPGTEADLLGLAGAVEAGERQVVVHSSEYGFAPDIRCPYIDE